ncbi:protein LTV1 homolog [Lineus longissimus]|uniref:protein LTV1 homolog n=1 Tax=Lineus longissimus TaxID=88925 RepID=UPI002B4F99F2
MPNKKKKFIDKKNAVTFHLVHRGQRDPLQASEDASQRVLLPVGEKERDSTRREEQKKYGVFFDDGYDYLQHLKDVNEINDVEPIMEPAFVRSRDGRQEEKTDSVTEGLSKLQLPSSVFGSELETDVGMLNKAAPTPGPRLDWDPDVVAALDDDFDFDNPDNELDDDFVVAANMEVDESEGKERRVRFGSDADSDDDDDIPSDEADLSDDDGYSFEEEETKTRFTNYSMTSSVIKRNQGLTLLDDRFEKVYEQYDDDEIGALDHEEIDGNIQPESKILTSLMEEFEQGQQRPTLKDMVENAEDIEVEEEDSDGLEHDLVKMVVQPPEEKWDCESILSTYSTLYNHPTTIKEPKKPKKIVVDPRTGLPETSPPMQVQGLTEKEIQQAFTEKDRADKASTFRPKDESAEEKKDRKQAVKDERRERRAEKKATKQAFKDEHLKQQKERLNAHRTDCIRMS